MKLPFLITSALLAPLALCTPAVPGIRIEVESLGLRFEAPSKWRVSRNSTADELVLYPGKSKTTPVLRIRAFHGDFSAEDRLAAMTRGLSGTEAGAHFVSSEKWAHEMRRYETAQVENKIGAKDSHGSFTIISQPRRVQHGFWLYGTKQDVTRHWEDVRTSIITAEGIRLELGDAPVTQDAETPEEAVAIWSDKQSGLQVASWPAGFTLKEDQLDLYSKHGLQLQAIDERANSATAFVLFCEKDAKEDTAIQAATALNESLQAKSSVTELRQLPVRVGGIEAQLLKWTEESGSATLAYQVHFVQKGKSSFRIDYTAEERWARSRSRRSLVKDFILGLSFE
ncbi:MAG: hypothetical protein ACI8X5_000737 [Planctomycetota bacterium]|jgi:hypothetical protein